MKAIYAPEKIEHKLGHVTIFLAGSIEMGNAEEWQEVIIKTFADSEVVFLNPRRKDWDSSWKQSKDDPKFSEQVNWELDGLSECDLVVVYFDPKTQSPITMMELGIFGPIKHTVVYCPDGFWRKGNIDIVCERFGIHQIDNPLDLIEYIESYIKNTKQHI